MLQSTSRFFNKIEEDFKLLTPDKKIYGAIGGNRSSKTVRGAAITSAWLLGRKYLENEPSWRHFRHLPIPERGVNLWVIGLSFDVVRGCALG